LTFVGPTAILHIVPRDPSKSNRRGRAPRIRVPNSERALFTVDTRQFVGVIQRLSLTGGSAILAKGPIPQGTLGEMVLKTVFGNVEAHIEFLQTNADGVPLAQAFRFLAMDDDSMRRFEAAAAQMVKKGFSDAEAMPGQAFAGLGKLLRSVRQLAANISSNR
jgi:hypothetical protein